MGCSELPFKGRGWGEDAGRETWEGADSGGGEEKRRNKSRRLAGRRMRRRIQKAKDVRERGPCGDFGLIVYISTQNTRLLVFLIFQLE